MAPWTGNQEKQGKEQGKTKTAKGLWHEGPPRVGTFSMRATRFRQSAGCLSWSTKDGKSAEPGMVVEELDIEIGAGVSSKGTAPLPSSRIDDFTLTFFIAICRRRGTDKGGQQGPHSTRDPRRTPSPPPQQQRYLGKVMYRYIFGAIRRPPYTTSLLCNPSVRRKRQTAAERYAKRTGRVRE